MAFLGSDELAQTFHRAKAARDEAQIVLDAALWSLWDERPDGWTMTQVAELSGCSRAEIVTAIGRHEGRMAKADTPA